MRENPGIKRQFQRGAYNAAVAFNNTRRAKETIANLPKQLAELQQQLEQEKNSKYPDNARIKRIQDAIALKQQQVARYCSPAKE